MEVQGIRSTSTGIGKFFAEFLKPVKLPVSKAKLDTHGKRNFLLVCFILLLTGVLTVTTYIFATNRSANTDNNRSLNPRLVDQQDSDPSGAGDSQSTGGSNDPNNQSSTTNDQSTGSSTDTTTVTVNGQPVNVPANGSYNETIGNTTVSGNSQQSSSSEGGSVSNSSTNTINVHSQ